MRAQVQGPRHGGRVHLHRGTQPDRLGRARTYPPTYTPHGARPPACLPPLFLRRRLGDSFHSLALNLICSSLLHSSHPPLLSPPIPQGSWRRDFCVVGLLPLVKLNLTEVPQVFVASATGPGGMAGPLRVNFHPAAVQHGRPPAEYSRARPNGSPRPQCLSAASHCDAFVRPPFFVLAAE